MWLLHAKDKRLKYFDNERQVPGGYAIVSHTWGQEEVTFQDVERPAASEMKGYRKIEFACKQALEEGLDYVWIDTCCIDKKSSAELSEAINSMFNYYRNAEECYVYLSDVGLEGEMETSAYSQWPPELDVQFWESRWHTRGWTLQELIAPSVVMFYDKSWHFLGDKHRLVSKLSQITHVDSMVLKDRSKLPLVSVAKRMYWAAMRGTSRVEDRAYSLLGIFDVNMPLLYGEGIKSFQRLQIEIIQQSSSFDHSILAWMPWERLTGPPTTEEVRSREDRKYNQLLSPSPYGFRYSSDIIGWAPPQSDTFELSQRGLRMTAYVKKVADTSEKEPSGRTENYLEVALNCRYEQKPMTCLALTCAERPHIGTITMSGQATLDEDEAVYDRIRPDVEDRFQIINARELQEFVRKPLLVARQPFVWPKHESKVFISVNTAEFSVIEAHDPKAWDKVSSTLSLASIKIGNSSGIGGWIVLKPANSRPGSKHILITMHLEQAKDPKAGLLISVCWRAWRPDWAPYVDSPPQPPWHLATHMIPHRSRYFERDLGSVLELKTRSVSLAEFWNLNVRDMERHGGSTSIESIHEVPSLSG